MYIEPIGIKVNGPGLMLLDLWVHLEDLPTDQQTHVRELRKRGDSTLRPADFAWIRLRWSEWNSKRKGTQMAKKKDKGGEQIALIDVAPENLKKMLPVLKRYEAAKKERMEALQIEVKEKRKLLDLIEESDLQTNRDGSLSFECDGCVVTVKPRDELISVKKKGEAKSPKMSRATKGE